MKILFVITKSEEGGAETHVSQLCRFFVKEGNEVHVMSHGGGWLENEVRNAGATFVPNDYLENTFKPSLLCRAGKEIQKEVDTFKPDLVSVHSSIAGLVTRLTVMNKVPTVFTSHGWDFADYRSWSRRFVARLAEKVTSKYCKKIICVSEFVKNLAIDEKIVSPNKLVVIPNGIETPRLEHKAAEDVNIVFVGRLAVPKDPMMLLSAYSNLPGEEKNKSKLIIIGDGPQKATLEKIIKEKNLSSKVVLTGSRPREDVMKMLSEAGIFVLTSKWESFGLTALEAMSLSVPVIASNVGGLPEVVGKAGILVNTENELKTALTNLIRDDRMRAAFGENAKKRSLEFSLDKMLNSTKKLFEEIV